MLEVYDLRNLVSKVSSWMLGDGNSRKIFKRQRPNYMVPGVAQPMAKMTVASPSSLG